MPRIPVQTVDSAPEVSRPILEAIVTGPSGLGRVINVQGQLAKAPAALDAYIGFRQSIEEHATLEPRIRSAIQLSVSSVNDCDYSLAINTMLMKRAGWSDDDIAAVRRGTFDADPKVASILAVVRQAAAHAGAVDDRAWATAIDAGWTPSQLVEAFVCIGLMLSVDYFVAYAETAIDVPADRRTA